MATFVLIHGAWHGGWCWKKVVPILRDAGHEVYAPTLTGLGERAHLLTPDIDLTTHVNDILGVLECEDLQQVILVGHSYGGMVISGAAERAAARLAQLVYLDAFFPESGKAVADYGPGALLEQLAQARGDGWRLAHTWMSTTEEFFNVTDPVDLAWVNPRLGDQPLKTFLQPVQLPADAGRSLVRTYIQTTHSPLFEEAAERARQAGFRYAELFSAGHDAMVTQPVELARMLIELIGH